MSSSSFPADPKAFLVADASVVINLNATARAADIIRALPNQLVVTRNSLTELKNGASNGHADAKKLETLVSLGVVSIVDLGDIGNSIYTDLIEGSAVRTLDDGEAATIGFASERSAAAIIDERKGRNICADFFPSLLVLSTVDLLTHANIEHALGREAQVDAILSALRLARMRVPLDRIEEIVRLIGSEQAASCPSLPNSRRRSEP